MDDMDIHDMIAKQNGGQNMKIGITERGDAALDFSWFNKLSDCDGAILITKNITNAFGHKLLQAHNAGNKIILHCTCTGWGGTNVEPDVPDYAIQLRSLSRLTTVFPKDQTVLRIDPIIPDKNGLTRVESVLKVAFDMGLLPNIRVRVSLLDNYKHVQERFRQNGMPVLYNGQFQCSGDQIAAVRELFEKYNVKCECCAEPGLTGPNFEQIGCISYRDIGILGLQNKGYNGEQNPQNRHGCLCLDCKTELLENRTRCGHNCLYCYWKG